MADIADLSGDITHMNERIFELQLAIARMNKTAGDMESLVKHAGSAFKDGLTALRAAIEAKREEIKQLGYRKEPLERALRARFPQQAVLEGMLVAFEFRVAPGATASLFFAASNGPVVCRVDGSVARAEFVANTGDLAPDGTIRFVVYSSDVVQVLAGGDARATLNNAAIVPIGTARDEAGNNWNVISAPA